MRIAIVDDEQVFREKEKQLLEDYDKRYKIETFSSTKGLLASTKTFDLLLLDIEMPDDDGIEFAKYHVHEFPYIIFVTSHDDMMQDAFHMNVIGFIVKDSLNETFIKRIEASIEKIEMENMRTFKTQNGLMKLLDRNIECFYVTYECIYVVSGEATRIHYPSFKELCESLPDNYFRISRDVIVNLHNIEAKYIASHEIEMHCGKKLKVSERKWNDFKIAYVKAMK